MGVASLLAQNVQAAEVKPVVGLDYVYSKLNTNKVTTDKDGKQDIFKKNFNAFAFSAGAKIDSHFGLEAFYQQSEQKSKITKVEKGSYKVRLKYKVFGLDALGYMPIAPLPQLDLVGSLGTGYYRFEGKDMFFGEKKTKHKLGFRAGLGVQYNVTENVSARVMARYNYNNTDFVDSFVDLTAGFRFYF